MQQYLTLGLAADWILAFRSDLMTSTFRLFPFLASDYFYITIIAIGFWLKPERKLFAELGFLIPCSTFANCILKNLFQILRPDTSLHLVAVHDPFGFPSGDVQVATVFWIIIFFTIKNHRFYRYLCFLPIVGIAISRVYLGVHSVFDVLGGMAFGLLTVYIWKNYLFSFIFNGKDVNLWILLTLMVGTYSLISTELKWPPMIPVSIGVLVGLSFSLTYIKNLPLNPTIQLTSGRIVVAMGGIVSIILLALFIPVLKTNELTIHASLIVKYTIIVFGIFSFFPQLLDKIFFKKLDKL